MPSMIPSDGPLKHQPLPELVEKGKKAATIPQKIGIFLKALGPKSPTRDYFYEEIGKKVTVKQSIEAIRDAIDLHAGNADAKIASLRGKIIDTLVKNIPSEQLNDLQEGLLHIVATNVNGIEFDTLNNVVVSNPDFVKDLKEINSLLQELSLPREEVRTMFPTPLALTPPTFHNELVRVKDTLKEVQAQREVAEAKEHVMKALKGLAFALEPKMFEKYTDDDFKKVSLWLHNLTELGISGHIKLKLRSEDIPYLPEQSLTQLMELREKFEKPEHLRDYRDMATSFFEKHSILNPKDRDTFVSLTQNLASSKQPMAFFRLMEKSNPDIRPYISHFFPHIDAALTAGGSFENILIQVTALKNFANNLQIDSGYSEKAIIYALNEQLKKKPLKDTDTRGEDFKKAVCEDCLITSLMEIAQTDDEKAVAEGFIAMLGGRQSATDKMTVQFYIDALTQLKPLLQRNTSIEILFAIRNNYPGILNVEAVKNETKKDILLKAFMYTVSQQLTLVPKKINAAKFAEAAIETPFTAIIKPLLLEYLKHLPGLDVTKVPSMTIIEKEANTLLASLVKSTQVPQNKGSKTPAQTYAELLRGYIPFSIPILNAALANKTTNTIPLLNDYIETFETLIADKTKPLPATYIPTLMLASKKIGPLLAQFYKIISLAETIGENRGFVLSAAVNAALIGSDMPAPIKALLPKSAENLLNTIKSIDQDYKDMLKKSLPVLIPFVQVALLPLLQEHKPIVDKLKQFLKDLPNHVDASNTKWTNEEAVRKMARELIAELKDKELLRILPGLAAVADAASRQEHILDKELERK